MPAQECITPVGRRLLLEAAVRDGVAGGPLARYKSVADSRGLLDAAEGLIIEAARGGFGPGDLPDGPAAWLLGEYRRRLAAAGRADPPEPAADESSIEVADRPIGLVHLSDNLFAEPPRLGASADGLSLIEAPGRLGEARMVARLVRERLDAGVAPGRIAITARHMGPRYTLIEEVFAEYGIPFDSADERPAAHDPLIAAALKAARLPDADWPFAAVTALLRSGFFAPEWPEAAGEMPLRAEALLRMLGEARGRDAYQRAVRVWAERPPEGLEDEQAEGSRRRRQHKLAVECRPFLRRFFAAWDGLPNAATAAAFVSWLGEWAGDLGFDRNDAAGAWPPFTDALRGWAADEHLGPGPGKVIPRSRFLATLNLIAGRVAVPRAPAGGVRLLPAEGVGDCDVLVALEMGEGGFPDLGGPTSLLTDADRGELASAGFAVDAPAGRLDREMALFRRLVARPRRELVLARPAVDERGQPLLPGTFLRAAVDVFGPDVIPVSRRRMLTERLFDDAPLCDAERRLHYADRLRREAGTAAVPDLPADTLANLHAARDVAQARFRTREFGPFDGWADSAAVAEEMATRFGPRKVFSPTALETYIDCPFKFMLQHVLRLEPLEDPAEQIEATRRGAAFHRAMSRFHLDAQKLRRGMLSDATLPEAVTDDLVAHLHRAVEEYVERAPGEAARVLWRLEGRRLERAARRYRADWEKFLAPWREAGAVPTPHWFELDFGVAANHGAEVLDALTLDVDGVQVQVGGRIDRVDVAEAGGDVLFWVIDYKTGRASHYTATDLKSMHRLQLAVYALAVSRVAFAGRPARPLGLAYWMLTDGGAKAALPTGKPHVWLADAAPWAEYAAGLERRVAAVVSRVRDGRFPLAPRLDDCTATCPYGQACRISQARAVGKSWES